MQRVAAVNCRRRVQRWSPSGAAHRTLTERSSPREIARKYASTASLEQIGSSPPSPALRNADRPQRASVAGKLELYPPAAPPLRNGVPARPIQHPPQRVAPQSLANRLERPRAGGPRSDNALPNAISALTSGSSPAGHGLVMRHSPSERAYAAASTRRFSPIPHLQRRARLKRSPRRRPPPHIRHTRASARKRLPPRRASHTHRRSNLLRPPRFLARPGDREADSRRRSSNPPRSLVNNRRLD